MLKIKIDLIKLDEEESERQNIKASAFIDDRATTEGEKLARDILAPLAVAELYKQEANADSYTARKLGELFADSCAVCGGAVWSCAVGEERQALTLADGFRPRGFGQVSRGGCFILILENDNEEERAYLVRPNW